MRAHFFTWFIVASCFLFIFSVPTLASAATLYVNSSTGNDTTGTGSAGAPYKTFTKAYASSSASDTLNLTGTFSWNDSDETGDSSGTGFTINKNLTITGQSAASTIIQASTSENTADRGVFTIASGRTVTIQNVTIRYGVTTATETGGGITNSGTLNVYNSILSNNRYNSTTNYYGGGAIMMKHDANGTLNLSTSTISNNTFNGKYYGSGGIYAGQSNTMTVTASTFTGNLGTSSDPTTFTYSYADPSGALGVFRFVTTVVTNSTFSGNTTNSYDATLQVYYPNSFKITNSTIANNTASVGTGGILFESVTDGYNLHLRNTILANNTGGGSAADFYVVSGSAGRVTDNGYNIVEVSTNKTWSGTANITGDQASLNLASSLATNDATNGVQTLALSSGSVAINAGTTSSNSSIAIPSVDQRGGARNSSTDIGAYEYGSGSFSDVTAPSISSVASSTTYSTATITWTTDESATSTVNYGATSSYGSASTSASSGTSHSITLSGLSASTAYHFQA